MSENIDSDGYRANVGIILVNGEGHVFLAGRAGRRGWQFPQGGIRRGESAEEAMFRELTEEIGLDSRHVEVVGSTRTWLRYELPQRYVRQSQPLCIGQKQRWFVLRLVDPGAQVRFDSTDEPEFDRWRWVDYWHPVREVIYFKRHVYASALKELGPLVFPEGPPPIPSWWPSSL